MKVTLIARIPGGKQDEHWWRNSFDARVKPYSNNWGPGEKMLEIEVVVPDSMLKLADEIVVGSVEAKTQPADGIVANINPQ